MGSPLDIFPLWLLVLLSIAGLFIALEAGYRAGQWRHAHSIDEKEQSVSAMVASILGLVALLLGFSFSLASSRFEARREVVLREANAIGTAYLRAKLLPAPHGERIQELLSQYIDARLRGVDPKQLTSAIAESEKIHGQLWNETSLAAAEAPQSILVGVFIQSLNEVIDLHAERTMIALRSRIPLTIWLSLATLATLGVASIGYQAGIAATKRSPAMIGIVLSFIIVLGLIMDLDRGREGFIRVGQQAMIDLRHSVDADRVAGDSATPKTQQAADTH
jgi:hypothetical protein